MEEEAEQKFVDEAELSDEAALRLSRKRKFGGPVDEDAAEELPGTSELDDSKYESKHTLESDEEDAEKYERLDKTRIHGEEEATVEFSGETKVTPFNMRDEMEEGHFDAAGTFIFDKQQEEIKDAWLDNVDWARVKSKAGELWQEDGDEGPNDDEPPPPQAVDRVAVYLQLLSLLQPRETVTKALRRLAGKPKTAAEARKERWQLKKSKAATPSSVESRDRQDEELSPMLKLTALVDGLVSDGEFEAYGFTYEKIKYELDKLENKMPTPAAAMKETELDMFAENVNEAKLQQNESGEKSGEAALGADSQVSWEYRLENREDAEIRGPHSSEEMQKMKDDGTFKEVVWVRRCSAEQGAPFYSSSRIDFDLYI